jgi:pullulanase
MAAAFNNGTLWDNNNSANYTINAGLSTVKDGTVTSNAPSPCGTTTTPPPPPPPTTPSVSAPARLGVIYTATQSTFSLWSPDSSNVVLNLNGATYPMVKAADANGYTDVYAVTVPGNHHLKTYNFQVNGTTTRDPYGVMVQPGTDNNVVLDLSQTALPGGWAPTPALANRTDSVIYETHVRDLTIDASSGVPAAQRGTYAGMTAAGTTVNGQAGAPKTGIDHLVDLGVTHVQILPIYDFGSCSPSQVASNPNCYNWGYDPINYNVPEERYSQTPNDPVARVREFKAMIDGFHKRGVRVVMDVVYNHTLSKDVLGNITQKYYNPTDMSGTGNSLDGSQPMVARMIRDSLDYWVREYNIDGFRFDLMGVFDTNVANGWGTYLNATYPNRNLLLYGEPWTGGIPDPQESQHVRYGSVGTIANAHIGVFNGAFRDAIKNSKNDSGGSGGFIFNQDTPDGGFGPYNSGSKWPSGLGKGAMSLGVKGSPLISLPATQQSNVWTPMFTSAPEQSMNYADIHDNLCLADKVTAWAADNGQSGNAAYLGRLQEFALSIVLTSQGIPILHGGSEMGRSKNGDANSYQSPDSVNSFKWGLLSTNPQIYAYVKKLISLRRTHPGFRFTTWSGVDSNVQSDQRSASLVYTLINSGANGDGWSKTLLIYNSGGDQAVTLPAGNWSVAAEGSSAPTPERVVSGSVTAAGTSITLLHQ